MPQHLQLFPELVRAGRNLEERLNIVGIPGKIIPSSGWELLSEDIRMLIPQWLPELLSIYHLAGVWLQFDFQRWESRSDLLGFLYPQEYAALFSDESPVRDLIGYGFFPFA